MAVHFHPLKVKAVNRETEDCVSIVLDIPDELKETYQFEAGQNITIKHRQDGGDELRRSYSICTAPHEQQLKVAVKKVAGGSFSNYANTVLKAGDVLEVLPPTGRFTVKQTGTHFLAIAAGSGITPVIGNIKHILATQPKAVVYLVYASKTRQGIIFFEELEALKNVYLNRFSVVYVLSQEFTEVALNHGRINTEKLNLLQRIIPFAKINEAFICGPEQLIFEAAAFLEGAGIPKSNIHFELFNTPGVPQLNKAEKSASNVDTEASSIKINLDGRQFQFMLNEAGNSILDAALQAGADLPYACKGGVCSTCRAKLVSGEVAMDINYALEAEEVAAGFILTCQSHPKTKEVVIDFDVK